MNIEKYRQIFIDETSTELNKLENLVLEIDKASSDIESVNSIFRLFHRLKSSSAMMGLNNFSDLSHHAENLLSMINEGSITMEDTVVAMLLSVIDAMRNLVREAETGNITGNKPEELIEEIDEVCRIAKSRINMPAGDSPVPDDNKTQDNASPVPSVSNESESGKIVHGMNIIRINETELNDLIDMAGELTSTVSDLDRVSEYLDRISSLKDVEIAKNNILSIKHKAEKLSLNIHTQLLRSKMVPAGEVFERLKRVIHDLSIKTGKCIQVLISGADIELDRAVVDKLFNPLLHIVRNAVDHGIEMEAERAENNKSPVSTINISAVLQGHYVIIAVEDDGRGIVPGMIRREIVHRGIYDEEAVNNLTDRDILNCLFIPGFSTKAEATELSGRGMGLDIVRENVREMKGSVDISSIKGIGTTFMITIPQTLSIIRCLQVLIGNQMFSIPSESILEITPFIKDSLMYVRSRPLMLYRGSPISMADLYGVLNITSDTDSITACIISGNSHVKIAIPVKNIVCEQDILIKHLGPAFSKVEGMLGVGILSGGRMSLIIDTDFLLKQHSGGGSDDTANSANS
jgi:two-component system chemotaxis sensor kinase CheA